MDLLLDYSGAVVFYVVLSAPFVVPILKGRRLGMLGLTLTTVTLVVSAVIIFIAHDTPQETALIGADMPEMDQMLGTVMLVSGLAAVGTLCLDKQLCEGPAWIVVGASVRGHVR